jgi:hypothetical protein
MCRDSYIVNLVTFRNIQLFLASVLEKAFPMVFIERLLVIYGHVQLFQRVVTETIVESII